MRWDKSSITVDYNKNIIYAAYYQQTISSSLASQTVPTAAFSSFRINCVFILKELNAAVGAVWLVRLHQQQG
jgi:hypothetical protein